MTPAATAARTAIQLSAAQAVVIVADLFPGDEIRRGAAAALIGYGLALGQNLLERAGGWKLFAGRVEG